MMSGKDSTTRISSKVGVFIPALGHMGDRSSKAMHANSCIQLGIYRVTSSIFIKFPNMPTYSLPSPASPRITMSPKVIYIRVALVQCCLVVVGGGLQDEVRVLLR